MAKKNHIQRVHIWDDPESRINFLETSLGNQGWSAVVHAPTKDSSAQELSAIQNKLADKSYVTKIGTDKENNPVLFVTKLGTEDSFISAIEKLGLVKGAKHSFESTVHNASKIIGGIKNVASFWTENKAKRIGSLYLVGDLVITSNSSSDTSPEKWWKTGYGILGAAQSLIFMNYATEADAQISKEINRKFANYAKDGKSITTSLDWLDKEDPASAATKFLEKNAINVGAWTQIAGRGLWTMAGIKEIQRGAKGGWERISDSAMSILGWVLFMVKGDGQAKEGESKILSHIKKYSNRIGGALNAGSTIAALKGATAKMAAGEEAKSDLAGNIAYLLGDVTVFVTDSMDYDAKSATHPQNLARIASEFLKKVPSVLGQSAKLKIAENLANHLAEKANGIEKKKNSKTLSSEGLDKYKTDIYNAILTQLPHKALDLAKIAAKVADISLQFPKEQQEHVRKSIAKELLSSPAILATFEEIDELMNYSLSVKKPAATVDQMNIENVNSLLSDLVKMTPQTMNEAEFAISIFNAAKMQSVPKKQEVQEIASTEIQLSDRTAKPHPRINSTPETGVGTSLS